ncbi:hypothetical protein ACQP2T_27055 [Nonomuraea sp. CA-143628]|uniref:hypothetical protein n=1 Tax=Nonomuraea sp. CA-143628 TaxID=3239997 RepID=UPI003D8F4A92
MPMCPKPIVDAPTVEPAEYGLFSVAQRPAPEGAHWRCGVRWEPYACDAGDAYGDQCDDSEQEKSIRDGVPLAEADSFSVHDGYLCRLPGRPDEAEIRDRAETQLKLGEQRLVERVVWTGEAGTQTVDPHLADPAAVVLNAVPVPTAADALSLLAAIAALEAYLGANYGGRGVIHAPRLAGAHIAHAQLAAWAGATIRTLLDNAIAFYSGSPNTGPDGSPAPAGTAWLYVTGAVFIRSGPVLIIPNAVVAGFNRATNEVLMIAEREYVVGWDCVHAAVLADLDLPEPA